MYRNRHFGNITGIKCGVLYQIVCYKYVILKVCSTLSWSYFVMHMVYVFKCIILVVVFVSIFRFPSKTFDVILVVPY